MRADSLQRAVPPLLCLLLLGAAARYTFGSCEGTCVVVPNGGGASVTSPGDNCPTLTRGAAYTFSSSHTLVANKTRGANVSCSIAWSGRLWTDEGHLSSLDVTRPFQSFLNGTCGPVTFTKTVSSSYAPPVTGTHNAHAETSSGGSVYGPDSKCFTVN
jgi:hypothetical protein